MTQQTVKSLQKIIQLTIGILFILSGALKAVDSQAFAVLLKTYSSWSGIGFIAPVISGIEIVAGLFLVLNIRTRSTSLLVACLTFLFTLAFAYAFVAKGIEDCGCMGSFVKIPPFLSFARNIFIIAGSLWIWNTKQEESAPMNSREVIIFVIGCLSFLVAGYSLGKPIVPRNKIHEGDKVSRNIFRFFDPAVFRGKTIVFVFSPNCSHCWNATENVKSIKEIPEFSNLIGVTYKDADLSGYINQMQPNFEIVNYPTSELNDVITEVPILLVLNNGSVEKIFDSHDIPCGKMLQFMLEGK